MKSSAMFGTAVTPKASPVLTGRVPETPRDVNSEVKLFMRCDAANWLFAELGYDDVTFGPCDLRDCSELRHDAA